MSRKLNIASLKGRLMSKCSRIVRVLGLLCVSYFSISLHAADEKQTLWVVGSFGDQTGAERTARQVSDLIASDVLIQTVAMRNQTRYRVLVAPGTSDGDRLRTESLLRSDAFDDFWKVTVDTQGANLQKIKTSSSQYQRASESDSEVKGAVLRPLMRGAASATSEASMSTVRIEEAEVKPAGSRQQKLLDRPGSNYHPIRLRDQ